MDIDLIRRYFKRIPRTAERYYNSKMTEGLTPQEANALRMISACRVLSQQALARILGIDKSQVTRLIKKLEENNYVTRTVNPEDRREKLITATERADAVRAQDLELTNHYYEWLLSVLSEKERDQFFATLEQLAERAKDAMKNKFTEVEDLS